MKIFLDAFCFIPFVCCASGVTKASKEMNALQMRPSSYRTSDLAGESLTVEELKKMAQLFGMTTDQILNYDGKIPKEVVIEDKTAIELVWKF